MESDSTADQGSAFVIAKAVRDHRAESLAAWQRRVLADVEVPSADQLSRTLLLDDMPRLLDGIAGALDSTCSDLGSAEHAGRHAGSNGAVRDHARERIAERYALAEALRELSHLRSALIEVLASAGVTLGVAPALLVHGALDEALRTVAIEVMRVRREEARTAAERLQLVAEAAQIGLWDWDLVTQRLEFDPIAKRIFGLEAGADVSYPIALAAVHPRDRERVEAAMTRALSPGGSDVHDLEYRVIGIGDGIKRSVAKWGRVFFDAGGRPVRFVGVLQDITERKREEGFRVFLASASAMLQNALDAEESLERLVHLAVPGVADVCFLDLQESDGSLCRAAVAHVDPETESKLRALQYTYRPDRNPASAVTRVVQSGRAELVADVTPDFVATLLRHVESDYAGVIESLGMRSLIVAPLVARGRALGALSFLMTSSHRRYGPRDLAAVEEAAALIAIAIDNARLFREARASGRRAEDALALLDGFFERSPAGLGFFDRGLRYVRVNEALARINNRPAAEHVGRRLAEIVPSETARALDPLIEDVFATGRVRSRLITTPGTDENGRPAVRHIHRTFFPVSTSDGAVMQVGAVVMDMTERESHAAELRREAEFRERFIAILGHDLRTPLSAVLLRADALARTPMPAPQIAEAAQRIVTSAHRMERMIGDLLDFARARRSDIPLRREHTTLDAVCRSVIEEVSVSYPDREVQLAIDGDCRGEWDLDRITQVLSNLVTNALDYSPAGSPVRVSATCKDESTVAVAVHNEGTPIPPEVVAALFEPFRRAASVDGKRARKGLGLGLFIAREIVRSHGGTIEVQSAEGEGTTFNVTLPRVGSRGG